MSVEIENLEDRPAADSFLRQPPDDEDDEEEEEENGNGERRDQENEDEDNDEGYSVRALP